jgi:type IV secretory pathway VirB2 component (pilin)
MRRMRITKLTAALMCGALGLAGHYAGLQLPWEALVQSALMTAQLPSTRIAAFVVIVVTSALLIWGPGTSAVRKLTQLAYWIAVLCARRLIGDVFAKDGSSDRLTTHLDIDEERNAMNTDYEIVTKRSPNWTPTSVKDDGQKVYIRFPKRALQGQLPVLLIPDASGRSVATEYRIEGNFAVVDRLFNAAELRSFGARGCTVRIRLRNPRCDLVTEPTDLAA